MDELLASPSLPYMPGLSTPRHAQGWKPKAFTKKNIEDAWVAAEADINKIDGLLDTDRLQRYREIDEAKNLLIKTLSINEYIRTICINYMEYILPIICNDEPLDGALVLLFNDTGRRELHASKTIEDIQNRYNYQVSLQDLQGKLTTEYLTSKTEEYIAKYKRSACKRGADLINVIQKYVIPKIRYQEVEKQRLTWRTHEKARLSLESNTSNKVIRTAAGRGGGSRKLSKRSTQAKKTRRRRRL